MMTDTILPRYFEREIFEQPEVLARLLEDPAVKEVAETLRHRAPKLIVTLARGSSDHAVTFLGYLAGQTLGLPVASLPPSLLSVYTARMRAEDILAIGVSQSGESSDVVEGLTTLKRAGALTVALSNDPESSLVRAADYGLLQGAGHEQAVAASKTFSTQMLLLSLLVAHWGEDKTLLDALHAVPEALAKPSRPPSTLKRLRSGSPTPAACTCWGAGSRMLRRSRPPSNLKKPATSTPKPTRRPSFSTARLPP